MPSPPLPSGQSSQQPTPTPPDVEEQLDVALRQVETTKRLYQRLHEHNDDMETEFFRLRSVLEAFRNRLHFGLRNDAARLRGELESVRETVVFHTSTFQRELQALGRVLHSAISHGSVLACDHEILYSGSGRVAVGGHAAGRGTMTVAAPPPVSWLHSPSSKKPPRPGGALTAINPLERERERARLVLETPDDAPPHPARRVASLHKRRSAKRPATADGGVVSPRGGDANSSIEFFSDPETEAGSRPSKILIDRSVLPQQQQQQQQPPPSQHDKEQSTKPAPTALVLQAADIAQQRAIADRQSKKAAELADVVAQMSFDKVQLQSRLDEQDNKYQSYLKQMKEVHREETNTLRTQLDMMTAALMGQRQGGGGGGVRDAELDASDVPPMSSGVSPAASTRTGASTHGSARRSHQRAHSTSARSAAKSRAQVNHIAQELVEERHRLGLSPPEQKPTDVLRDGLWAQRVLEQRSTNNIVVRPLFKGEQKTQRSASSNSANGRKHSDRSAPAFKN